MKHIPLKWRGSEPVLFALAINHEYTIREVSDEIIITYTDRITNRSNTKYGCKSFSEAKHWVENVHLPSEVEKWLM